MSFENEVSCLKRSNLFRDLDDQELHLIASRLKQKTCATGTVVVKEGEPGDAMFIVKDGEVQVRRREAGSGSRPRLSPPCAMVTVSARSGF